MCHVNFCSMPQGELCAEIIHAVKASVYTTCFLVIPLK
jgi:hypothetical protein